MKRKELFTGLSKEEKEACLFFAQFFQKQAERTQWDEIPEISRSFIAWAVVNYPLLKRKKKL